MRVEAWAIMNANNDIDPNRIHTNKKNLTIGNKEKLVRVMIIEVSKNPKPGGQLRLKGTTAYEECLAILTVAPWKPTEEKAFEDLYTKAWRRGDYHRTRLAWLLGPRTLKLHRAIWVLYETYQAEGQKWYGENGKKFGYSLLRVLNDECWREPLEDKWK